jgi:hypothetical protein
MSSETLKSSLSYPEARLVEKMQKLGFGRIEGLVAMHGQPVFDPAPRVLREIKLGHVDGPRPELGLADFILKREVIDLFQEFRCLNDGSIVSIEVKYGLPFKMEVEHPVGT